LIFNSLDFASFTATSRGREGSQISWIHQNVGQAWHLTGSKLRLIFSEIGRTLKQYSIAFVGCEKIETSWHSFSNNIEDAVGCTALDPSVKPVMDQSNPNLTFFSALTNHKNDGLSTKLSAQQL